MPSPAERSGRALAVIGDIVEDVVVWLDEPIRPATDTASRVFRARGGSGANVAALAAASWPTRFIGCVGRDAAGDALAAELARHGVDARLQRTGSTGTVVLLVDTEGERTMFPDRGAAGLLDAVDPAWLDGIAHLHAPSYGFAGEPMRSAVLDALHVARSTGASLSIDASSTGLINALGVDACLQRLADIAPDYLIANAEESALLGIRPGRSLPVPERTVVIVKNGPRPTAILRGTDVTHVAVPPVTGIRDLTGAGDAFAAGFLTALLGGASPEVACLSGHGRAASVLASPGASTRSAV
ncbi:sugar kinase [Glaciibacter flavus]|uniref:Sugar kinase n=1 Tax=Orlajensenia flava TaxID=2565934 RepID=A0A4S4G1J3_9MICO|nr:PfkB family carbohydrate kinase [Glaciibacter flavus]THG36382.1 sugar kinase [Glaciibacter flavus]